MGDVFSRRRALKLSAASATNALPHHQGLKRDMEDSTDELADYDHCKEFKPTEMSPTKRSLRAYNRK